MLPVLDKKILLPVFLLFISLTGNTQPKDNATLARMVTEFKADIRGPYKDIRWFCKDGTTVGPHEQCAGEGAVQRARYKDNVIAIGKSNHIYFGQILSTTPNESFWDEASAQSRMKQYQLEIFLKAVDNGWISRRAQFYRGAFQAEDEEAWGIKFFTWALKDEEKLHQHFFLLRQSAKDIPHAAENNTAQSIRANSREISDLYAPFLDIRVKLHGQPDQNDVQRVKNFVAKHQGKLTPELTQKFNKLIADLNVMYRPVQIADFRAFVKKLPATAPIVASMNVFIQAYGNTSQAPEHCLQLSNMAMDIRQEIQTSLTPSARLALIDASNKLEAMLNREASAWVPASVGEQMLKVRILAQAAAGFGYLALWEWQDVESKIRVPLADQMTIKELNNFLENGQRIVEWGSGMIRGTYQDVIKLYGDFEPLAAGFIDDKVRSSVLLPLGSSVTRLGDFFALQAGFSNQVLNIPDQSSIRGLNPGYAFGELVVTNQAPEALEISADKIYVFNRPPADLKPVAGIATVTEGNMVSHVQLLARNLGIPNAVLSAENLNSLLPYNGRKVFYAVSNKGTVIIKPAEEMTAEEKLLFTKKSRSEEKISVPVERIELTEHQVLNLRDVNAAQSGIRCGPKAANLGQLKQMFPDNVVEGLVIPFSIFRDHFDQIMPGKNQSYWAFLNQVFTHADSMRMDSTLDADVEAYVLGRLSVFQSAIKAMPLKPEFVDELKTKFTEVFGKEVGQIPVFLRSDTNMEDLKDFTGAGLNLTLFNVLDADKIFQGIKDVWASPYTDRSYRWRQRYLLNPENVFPSILIIPSVNADYSGVLITKGVSTGKEEDMTVAFNRGVGGAVEGQASESWLLSSQEDNILLAPAREPEYTSIPATGGTKKIHTTFEERLLSLEKLNMLRDMSAALKEKLPEAGIQPPLDVELGFKDDRIWLFQVRPFVENKRAAASGYLLSITPAMDSDSIISLNMTL